jgi:hypothetical protein
MASYREQGPTERFEKRKLFRFPVQLPAQLGPAQDESSICTNLSTNGATFETSIHLTVGERLAVTVMIAPKEESLRMVGQVIWKRNLDALDSDSKKLAELGVRFLRPLPSLEKHGNDIPKDLPASREEEDEITFSGRSSHADF